MAADNCAPGSFVVISHATGDDPWEEGVFASRADAEAYIESVLADVARDGDDPDEWRARLRVQPAGLCAHRHPVTARRPRSEIRRSAQRPPGGMELTPSPPASAAFTALASRRRSAIRA
jgi:hypothetical protein